MKKLKIMLNAKIINKKQYNILIEILNRIQVWGSNDKDRFITHLSMVLSRFSNKQLVDPINNDIKKQIKNNLHYEACKNYINNLFEGLNIKLSNDELIYIEMHIINHLEREK